MRRSWSACACAKAAKKLPRRVKVGFAVDFAQLERINILVRQLPQLLPEGKDIPCAEMRPADQHHVNIRVRIGGFTRIRPEQNRVIRMIFPQQTANRLFYFPA